MPKLAPTNWQTQVAIFEAAGFKITREKGDHLALTKDGVARPVIIPKYKQIGVDIIKNNMRTAGMDRKRYFQLKGEE